ncbi:SDR family NAD(P)-dependent oxidoreductase [Rhodococcus zopfii]
MKRLDGRTAIVTGAGRGIGRAIALTLASEGANVVVNDLDGIPAEEVVSEIVSADGHAVAFPGSVTEDGFAEEFVGTAVREFGGVDIIVNNAGYGWGSAIQNMSDEQWDAMIDIHLEAPFRILRAAQPVISSAAKREHEAGRIVQRKVVNVTSILGLYGGAGHLNYSAAKSGLVGMTRTLAKEWGRYNVNVNAVAYGYIETRLTAATDGATLTVGGRELATGMRRQDRDALLARIPLRRAGTPVEAAGAAVMLTYPEADYVSGQVVVAAGGAEG